MTTAAADGRTSCAGPVTPSPAQIAEAVELLAEPWSGLRAWHKRHEAYRALVGALLSARLGAETVEAIVAALAEATDDEEADKRLHLIANTAARLHEGRPVQGGPALVEVLGPGGDDAVRRLGELLGVRIKRIVATYDYQDEAGCLRFQTVRYDPKDFKQRRPDGRGGWIGDLKGVPRLLYRLPELLNADPSQTVFLPEGEQDVDNLRRLGLTATTNPMGAGKWRREYNEALRGREVVVLPDNDEPGSAHARQVTQNLATVAASVKVLELPNLQPGGEGSDWLAAGETFEELPRLAAATPPWHDRGGETVPAEPAAPSLPPDPPWPADLAEEAFHGLAGEIVRTIGPASEADPAALLLQVLVGVGNLIGCTAHSLVEADRAANGRRKPAGAVPAGLRRPFAARPHQQGA